MAPFCEGTREVEKGAQVSLILFSDSSDLNQTDCRPDSLLCLGPEISELPLFFGVEGNCDSTTE